MVATINLPRILRVGAGASGQLVATLAELGLARPLLVTDAGLATAPKSAGPAPQGFEVKIYDISGERAFG